MTGRLDLLLQSYKCLRLYYSPSLLSLLLRLIKQYCFIFMITDPFHCVPYVQYLRHLYSFISITVIFSSNIFLWLLFIYSVSLLRLSFSHCSKYTHCLFKFCFVFRRKKKKDDTNIEMTKMLEFSDKDFKVVLYITLIGKQQYQQMEISYDI